MQEGDDPKWPLKIHATLKHYTAYSVETNRFGFIGNVSTYDVYDSFLPQYAAAFERGHAAGVMCSYMSLRIADANAPAARPSPPAHPSCASNFLLNQMVREEWGQQDALVVTDCEATSSMYQHNHLADNCSDAAVSETTEHSRAKSPSPESVLCPCRCSLPRVRSCFAGQVNQ
jgi:beta-D-xylosidase 4